MHSEDIDKILGHNGEAGYSLVIQQLIKDNERIAEEMLGFFDRYRGETPIKTRANLDKAGISLNNKISTDYDGIIVDDVVGYLFGNPIKVSYDVKGDKIINERIKRLEKECNLAKLDSSTGVFASCCGYGSRLMYFDIEGELRIMNTKPWETIFIYSNSTEEVKYALIHYEWTVIDENGKITKTTKVEFYDDSYVHYFIKDSGKFQREKNKNESNYQNPQPHNFDYVPVIKFKANELEKSDLFKAQSIIDAYHELISDAQNEIQEFVHSYLKTTGAEMDADERIKARRSGVFNIPDRESDIDFITKDINDTFFKHQKETLNEDIFKSSKTVDLNNENFTKGGAESGEARKWKMLRLEFWAITKERLFVEGLRTQYKIIGSAWSKKNIKFDYLNLNFQFTRALPMDYLYYAEIAQKLIGIIPHLDILKLLPFVDDPSESLARLKEESDIDLDEENS